MTRCHLTCTAIFNCRTYPIWYEHPLLCEPFSKIERDFAQSFH